MSMDIWVFDVGRGLCVALRTPAGYLHLVDCGCSDDFSPIAWLAKQQWVKHNAYLLAKLIITHPHCDHLADIASVTAKLKPAIILRRKDLDWARVTGSGSSEEMTHYQNTYMPPHYMAPSTDPDWGGGCEIKWFCLDVAKVDEVSGTDNAYVNNSSLIVIARYKGYCFAIGGDIEKEGMAALLGQNQTLHNVVSSGVHFYVAPHHGHPSGFSVDWFNVTGPTRIMNVVSERRKRENEDEGQTAVDSRYSQAAFSDAGNKEERRLASTKSDGHILISIADDGKWSWKAGKGAG